jgi:hypothetical protein
MQARWRDMALSNTKLCDHEGCYTIVLKPRRVCCVHLKGKRKVTQGRPINKGRNARGVALHRPDTIRTRKAKGQNTQAKGAQPNELRAVRANPARAIRSPKEEIW